MPVPDFKTYCAILDKARAGRFALPAASDLRASGKTMFAS